MSGFDRPPGVVAALLRGLVGRCPWCGQGRLFTGWFRMPEACPRCGLPLLQEDGAFLLHRMDRRDRGRFERGRSRPDLDR